MLVDTSVWRKYFLGAAAVKRLGDLLDEDDVVLVHPFVIGEMVLGGLSASEEALFRRLPSTQVVPHDEVLELIRRRRLMRRGIGWVDAHLLASALTCAARVWTTDAALTQAAAALGVDFDSAF